MVKLYKLLQLIFVFGVFTISVQAQDACEVALVRATDEFNAGHFHAIPALLKDCIDKGQTREWRQRAYLLLSETYLLLQDPIAAEQSYLEVLKANPEFIADPSRDPIDLVYLSSKFTATPIFTIFGKLGANTSLVRPILYRNVYTHEEKYKLRPGFHIGGGLEWNYNDNLGASVEGNFLVTSYQLENTNVFGHDNAEMLDRQTWFTIPIAVRYGDSKGKYRPYGYAGFSVDLLLSDKATITYTDVNPSADPDEQPIAVSGESPLLNFKSKRNIVNRSLFLGGGVKYKMGLRYAFLDVRYSFGLSNVVNAENSIYDYTSDSGSSGFQSSGDATFTWAHVDNLFRMDNLYVSIGYSYPLYKPRKLKVSRSKSVSRKIKKQGNEVQQD